MEVLKAEDGWLTVTGLFWLKPGENRIGTGEGDEICLPPGSAPTRVEKITLAGEWVRDACTVVIALPAVGGPLSGLSSRGAGSRS